MVAAPTIVAIASPPGRSLRGIIRISGADAFTLVESVSDRVGENDKYANHWGRGVHHSRLLLGARPTIPVWTFAFPGPHSYTGEDSVEMQLPGNPALLDVIVERLLDCARQRHLDVRRAEAGEFTARAFLNSCLSLTQAEGVAATIAAQSDAELAAARMLTVGRLGAFAHSLADDLASALALVEAGIDFTDQEDVVAITPADLHRRLLDLQTRMRSQLEHAVGIEQLRAIPWVVLVGDPNAGKSALFNALLGRERAVVSNVAGTTRDVLAEPLAIDTAHGPAEVMLVDLAGLDDADDSPINVQMQSAARHAIDRAELRLRCVANDTPTTRQVDRSTTDELAVATKCDLKPVAELSIVNRQSSIAVSTVTGEGLAALRRAIANRLANRAVSLAAGELALQPRHEQAMRSTLANLEETIAMIEPQRHARSLADAEIVASSMRTALNDLASLAGDITPDDILGRIFAGFCIGK